MKNRKLQIRGNELNGYCVDQLVDGEWRQITKRFDSYDEAVASYRHIEQDNELKGE